MLDRIAVLLVVGCCSLSAQAKYGGGSGDPNDPYLVYDANQMYAISADVNDWDKCFKLMADIDLGQFDGKDGRPKFSTIGYASMEPAAMICSVPFTGSFDGNNHTVSNFTYTSTDSNDHNSVGLFGDIYGPNSEVKNLGLIDPNVKGNDFVGSLVGLLGLLGEVTISNCYVDGGSVVGNDAVGGLVGWNFEGSITNCYSTGSISGNWVVGGLLGNNFGTISNCYSVGSVSGNQDVGGLVGNHHRGTITNCYSTGSVSGTNVVGGLAGHNSGTLINCYSVGSVTGVGYVGGLVGRNLCSLLPPQAPECGVIIGSCWNIETSGEPNMCGSQGSGASGCDPNYGKTTTELCQQSTFQDWDFINVWNIGENQTYPYLRIYLVGDINHDKIVNLLDFAIIADQWMEGVEE